MTCFCAYMMYIVGVQEHLQNILGSFVYNIDSREFIDNGTEVAFGASDPTCSKKKNSSGQCQNTLMCSWTNCSIY